MSINTKQLRIIISDNYGNLIYALELTRSTLNVNTALSRFVVATETGCGKIFTILFNAFRTASELLNMSDRSRTKGLLVAILNFLPKIFWFGNVT